MSSQKPTTKQKKLHPVNIRMDDDMLHQLRAIAVEEDRTVSNLVGRIVKEWLASRSTESR